MASEYAPRKSPCLCAAVACLLVAGVLSSPAPGAATATTKPSTVAELALYQGPDREQILLEGARKEGLVTFYTSNTWMAGPVAQGFQKKYPFIKVAVWRSDSKDQLKRVTEEYAARRFIADVLETNPESMALFHRKDMLQEYYSPEMVFYRDEVKLKGKNGAIYWANREIYISLGFKTQIVSRSEAPKSLKDLLNPKRQLFIRRR